MSLWSLFFPTQSPYYYKLHKSTLIYGIIWSCFCATPEVVSVALITAENPSKQDPQKAKGLLLTHLSVKDRPFIWLYVLNQWVFCFVLHFVHRGKKGKTDCKVGEKAQRCAATPLRSQSPEAPSSIMMKNHASIKKYSGRFFRIVGPFSLLY